MLIFECPSFEMFFDQLARFENELDVKELTSRQKDIVYGLIGDWFETAYDDLIYRIYEFPTNAGHEPAAYLDIAKDRGTYRQVTYEYRATYPDIAEIVARFTF